MNPIETSDTLEDFFRQDAAVLFFDAPWSQYSAISRTMMEFVERYAQMGEYQIKFFTCCFEGDLVPLAKRVVSVGVSEQVFMGNGAVSFFRCGDHVCTIRSVVGEGTNAVWEQLDQLRSVRC